MIGISLPFDWLLTGVGEPGLDRNKTLRRLKEKGVESVELRTVLRRHSAKDVLRVAQMLWNYGFSITVHSRMHTPESAVSDVFDPLRLLLGNMRQEKLVLVLHLIPGDSVAIARALAEHIDENGYPVTIALENNRLMPDGGSGDSAEQVVSVVESLNHPKIRICFDFGHYAYYAKKNGLQIIPPKKFINYVVHTHIHALDGLKTHYPLTAAYELPLDEMLEAVHWRYFGVYNFEPDFPRWPEDIDREAAIIDSVETLKAAMPPVALLYDKMRRKFDGGVYRALRVYNGAPKGTDLALVNASSYLFNTGGYRWAMDLAYRFANYLTKTPALTAELFRDVSLMVVTHGHVDHFEESTVRALAKTEMSWVIPDFMYEEAVAWGIRPEKILIAHKNEPICIDKLTILPFEGRHFRPITHKGVHAYGYYITSLGQPSMVFPTDVRDFSTEDLPVLPKADICFGHVFLGDGNSRLSDYGCLVDEFARFMLEFSNSHIILAHLYENGRRDEDMWRVEHADLIRESILAISPETRVTVPQHGEIIHLF